MLTNNFVHTPYSIKHDIASYNISKQAKRRRKTKLNVVKNTAFVSRNMSDRAQNVKANKVSHCRYINMLKYDKNHYDSLCYMNAKQNTDQTQYDVSVYTDYKPTNTKKRHKLKNSSTMEPLDINLSANLLISGYCNNLKHAEGISNDVLVDIINLYIDTSTASDSQQTQRAIASANFIGDIMDTFQKRNKCEFVENDSDHINLLDFVYVRGGALRDVILARDINDIDIIIDTNGLTAVYWQHLSRYHSTSFSQAIDCKCYLWQRYLNMYRKTADKYHVNTELDLIKRFEKHVVSSDFLLNARFFKDIIMNSVYNEDGEIYAVNTWSYTNWKLKIEKKLFYKWIDLNGSDFDIGDEMSNSHGIMDKTELHLQYDAIWDLLFDRMRRDCIKGKMNCIYGQYGRDEMYEYINIKLPLYIFESKYSTQLCDFTVNGLRLQLSQIFDDIYNTNQWYSKICSYKNDHNELAIRDIEQRVIRQPHLSALCTEEIYEGYFWRFIKIVTKFDYSLFENNTWQMNDNTVRLIRRSFEHHFRDLNKKKMKEFINRLLFWTIKDTLSYSEFAKIIKARLKIFELIGVDFTLKNAFICYPEFGNMLTETIDEDKKINVAKKRFLYRVLSEFCARSIPIEKQTKQSRKTITNKTTKTSDITPVSSMCIYTTRNYNWSQLSADIKPLVKIFTKKKMYKHYKFHDDDNIYKNNYYFNENNLKLSSKVRKKWADNHKKCTMKQQKRKKKLKKSKKSKQRSHFNVFLKKEKCQNVFAYYVC